MGDQDDGQAVLDLHLLEQLQNLCLDGDIQGGGGLVADQDLGGAGQGDGDDHPLAHPARKLVGILLETPFRLGDAHILQVLQGLGPGGRAFQVLVQVHGFQDLLADGLEGVQAGHGVLHDHGDLASPHCQPVLFLFETGQPDGPAGAVVVDGALGDGAVGVQQAHEGLGEHRLARAALPHDGQHLAGEDIQVDAPDGVEHAAPQIEADVHVAGGEDGCCAVQKRAASFTANDSWGRRRPRRRCRSGKKRW